MVPKLPVEDGLHAAQMLIPRCWFDAELTKAGLEALRQYHRAYNERLRTFRNTPVHDWSSMLRMLSGTWQSASKKIRSLTGRHRP